jgi:protein tyrosine/serine phosphatase
MKKNPPALESARALVLAFSLISAVCSAAPGKTAQLPQTDRPPNWAIALEKPGIPNLFQVSSNLFRSAQPTQQGMLELKAMKIKTVLSLRGLHDDDALVKGPRLADQRIRFHTWHPEDKDMLRFLKVVTDPDRLPVLVHCKRGIDRTGTMVAIYRMCIQGWSKEEAIREMTQGGFGYDDKFPNLVEYLRKLDIATLRKKAGLN